MSDKRPPDFDDRFRDDLAHLFEWRRDVRRFLADPVDPDLIEVLLAQACLSPSVGNSQPWRFVLVEDKAKRAAIRANFLRENAAALEDYENERRRQYTSLKLAGLDKAPVHLAVFADRSTARGHGLGRRTMPEMLEYSAVAAVNTLWLAARAHGIGVGWVSIIDPQAVGETLAVPDDWRLIAYLCIGYPEAPHREPELQRAGWQDRGHLKDFLFRR
ncbi:MAG: 5,6-dimethylbenzimidazole synthase [Rhodospirillaceae bacterium]|nr:5,6-dimethylbenzimidazole synthase [Rhodospirillaceae bacterium]MDD9928658.1 5,6-dimethylbenzimidazole synthase [Rhodospirillaceae bacterium]